MSGNRYREALRRQLRVGTSLRMTSMMDILTCLLLFLLKNFVVDGEVVAAAAGVELPVSTSEAPPSNSLVVAISNDAVLIAGNPVVTLAEVRDTQGLYLEPLALRLGALHRQRSEIQRLKGERVNESGKPVPPLDAEESAPGGDDLGVVTIQGDRDMEFSVLQKVMYTLSEAGYATVALAVINNS